MKNPRFAIMNDTDAPSKNHIAEWVEGVGYCYMGERQRLRRFDGMNPKTPTPIERFGFTVYVGKQDVLFEGGGEITATYEDGKFRPWKDRTAPQTFKLPLVKDARKRKG